MEFILSPLQTARYEYKPKLPEIYTHGMCGIAASEGEPCIPQSDGDVLKEIFPNTYGMKRVSFRNGENCAPKRKVNVGVILSGGQAPGGHNVITGLYDALKEADATKLNHRLIDHERCLVTPHSAYLSEESARTLAEMSFDACAQALLENRRPDNAVN